MKVIRRISFYLWTVILIAVDQIIKIAIVNNFKTESVVIIKNILRFTYCENKGVAFSIGSGNVTIFIVVNLLIICGLILYFEKNRKHFNKIDKTFFIMIIAGGVSNVIDRIVRGFVVDFIDVSDLFNFAIFNVADIFIVAGVCGLIISYIYKIIRNK